MTSTPKPKIPEDTYQALMEATFRALCKHGYTGLRVRDIDEEFEKSRQLINHYYDGKDDLIEAVLKYLLAEYERGITVGEDADPEAQLERYIQRFLHGQDIDGFDHWKFITALIRAPFTSAASSTPPRVPHRELSTADRNTRRNHRGRYRKRGVSGGGRRAICPHDYRYNRLRPHSKGVSGGRPSTYEWA